ELRIDSTLVRHQTVPQKVRKAMPLADAVIVIDLDNGVAFMNSIAEEFTGSNKSDALYQPLTSICRIVNEQSIKLEDAVEKAPQTGSGPSFARAILIARDGSQWPINDCSAPIVDAAGRTTGTVL